MIRLDESIRKILKGNRQIAFKYDLLDKNGNNLGDITADGNISFDSDVSIMRAGNFTIREIAEVNMVDERIRPWMVLNVQGGTAKFPLGTFILSTPNRQNYGKKTIKTAEAYDYSVILRDDKFDTRYTIASGTDYTTAVQTILDSAGITNYRITASDKALSVAKEFEIGTSKLDAINELLQAINYNKIWFDAWGVAIVQPYTMPYDRVADDTYDTDKNSIIKTGIEQELDTFSIPNVIIRYLETPEKTVLISRYENTSESSPLSIMNRGRKIVSCESVTDIADQTTLDAYVNKLASQAVAYETLNFKTALMPHHEFLDCLLINNKDIGATGKYIETAWKMELKVGGNMEHYCRKAVPIT